MDTYWSHRITLGGSMTSRPRTDTTETEIRITVDREFLETLQERLGTSKGTDVARSALTLLDWASRETQAGRMVMSSTANLEDVHRLVMPELMGTATA